MKKSQALKEIVFFVSGPEIDYSQVHSEAKNLNTYINEGNSTFLLAEKKNHEKNPFKTFLGFPIDIENFDLEKQEFNAEKLTLAASKQKVSTSSNEDDETFEIKYPTNPTKFHELASFDMLVITNSEETAKICHFTENSYFYTTKGYDKTQVASLLESKPVDLLFIDFNHAENDSSKIIEQIEVLLSEFKDMTPYVRIILPLQKINHNVAKNRHIQSNKEKIDFLSDLIPKQTWQFSQGDTKFDPNIETSISIMVNFKQNRNRKDKIESLIEYSTPNNFSNFGGGIVFSSAIIREISFELEKLPKFGA